MIVYEIGLLSTHFIVAEGARVLEIQRSPKLLVEVSLDVAGDSREVAVRFAKFIRDPAQEGAVERAARITLVDDEDFSPDDGRRLAALFSFRHFLSEGEREPAQVRVTHVERR
ncbi:MAG TPA: hypothetical protein VFS10_00345, partial [Pyrinomonadaceae bacterium]|nr:hypothetical protein [Pyrinomonadaceae bacterium]